MYKTGTEYLYPDLNFMALMLAVEKVTGRKLTATSTSTRPCRACTAAPSSTGGMPRALSSSTTKQIAAQELQISVERNVPGLP